MAALRKGVQRAYPSGWGEDRLHSRVVKCQSVVEMAQTVGCNTVVDGRDAMACGPATP